MESLLFAIRVHELCPRFCDGSEFDAKTVVRFSAIDDTDRGDTCVARIAHANVRAVGEACR